jgi:diguanylate cyclase (GGDEF)-like protein/putative nucleotidyltransferase with HDIG domain
MREALPKLSMRVHLLAAFLGLALLVSAVLFGITSAAARSALGRQLCQRLMAVAASGALMLDADSLAKLRTRQDEQRPEYARVKRVLQLLRDANPGIRYVYTMRPDPDPKRWAFLVDGEEDPKLVSHIGDLYDVSAAPEMWDGLSGPAADREPGADQWGTWLSGYAPIRDRNGRTVAILGLDMSVQEAIREERAMLPTAALGLALCLLLAVALAVRLASFFCRPIASLAEGTARVARGELAGEVVAGGSRELASLARSFNAMTSALRAFQTRMEELSYTDFLTGLRNHRYLQERLDEEISRAHRHQRPLSLVMLDLDHFRGINAAHGHQAGDDLLQQLAQVVRAGLRDSDIPTRYGGEEFAIIMPETSKTEAELAGERVRRSVEGHAFRLRSPDGPQQLQLTISLGVAELPDDTADKEGLIMAADVALLRAKHLSRNRVCSFSAGDELASVRLDPAELYRVLQTATLAAAASLAQALDARDHYTRGHSESVTRYALAIARAMGVPTEELANLQIAGLLHDIGKIGIPDGVLNKPGHLTEEEWRLVRTHPSVGASILGKAPLLTRIIPVVLGHHERFDGGGYPHGLAGEQIPLGARILAVADAYDAMTSHRPYRLPVSHEEALAELRINAGSQFDPQVVGAFERASVPDGDARPAPVAEES